MIDKKENMKRSLMKHIFTQAKRLKGFDPDSSAIYSSTPKQLLVILFEGVIGYIEIGLSKEK